MRNEASCLPRCPRQVPPTEPRRAGASQISVSVLLPQALRRLKGRFRGQGDRFFALPRRSAVGQIERLPPPGRSPRQRAQRAVSRPSCPRPRIGGFDPQKTFTTAPTDRRIGEKAVIRARLLVIPTAGSRQLVKQSLRFFQVGGVEALGEPVANWGKQIAGFGSPALFLP